MNKRQIAIMILFALNISCNQPNVSFADRCFFYFEHDNCDRIENYSDCYTNFVELCFDGSKYTAYQSMRGSIVEFDYRCNKDSIRLNDIGFNFRILDNKQISLMGTTDTIRLYEFNLGDEPSIVEILNSDLNFESRNFSIASRINQAFYCAFQTSEEEIANHVSTIDTLYLKEDFKIEPPRNDSDQ